MPKEMFDKLIPLIELLDKHQIPYDVIYAKYFIPLLTNVCKMQIFYHF